MLFPVLSAAALIFSNTVFAFSVESTVLVIAKDTTSAYSATSGLDAYGIPFTLVTVPSNGTTLPELTTAGDGNFGGIIVLSEVSYEYAAGYASALTDVQWTSLFDYQTSFGVRMVRIDVYPEEEFGVLPFNIASPGCCDTGMEQLISMTNTSSFSQAGMLSGATMTTQGLYHYPATITNASLATEIAGFGTNKLFETNTTAAVINNIGGREQMVWFISWAADWSPTSNYLEHAYITWMTRGLYVGFRRVYFSTQIDDMLLSTTLYLPNDTDFRVRPADLDDHVAWTKDINTRLPAGSVYFMEVGHNGNGNIEASLSNDTAGICSPDTAIQYPEQIDTPLEFQKEVGTGTDIWPATPATYAWSKECTQLDDLTVWWMNPANRDVFAHVSHTFTHAGINNATYSDVFKEITFNQAWLEQVGISTEAQRWSDTGLIPPAITGMHNGDALKAFTDNGVVNAVGDNTRPVLMNPDREHWPLTSTVENNGFAGFQITPRWATTIYFNCDLPECTVAEWVATSGGAGDIQALLKDAVAVNSKHLLSLHHDPYMFHQANMRSSDVNETVVNGVSAKWSIIQMWVEVVTQEMARLVEWPLISLKHDDIAATFAKRQALDNCVPKLDWVYSATNSFANITTGSFSNSTTGSFANSTTGIFTNSTSNGTSNSALVGPKSITGVTVTTTNNLCSVEVPVTFPGPVVSAMGGRSEQIGSDPLTVWVNMTGSPVSFTLATPIVI